MHRIDTKTAQKDKFGAGKNGFTRGNTQTGTPATDLDDDYFDMLQEELCSVVEASGASLEKARHDQLLTALRALLLSRKNPFGDIKSDGTVKTALENLGLGDLRFGAPLIGQRIDWPLELMPQEIWPDMTMEFIPYMAQSFDPVKYPLLAALHPENKLPADMRGYAPRGWDNGRGIDIDRELMSEQEDAIRNITGQFGGYTAANSAITAGAFSSDNATKSGPASTDNLNEGQNTTKFDVSLVVPTANENRMKNVAWNMIVRAK
ncbi:integrase [Escherichia coli]|nr:integrase [Escherichia coli]